MNNSVDYAITTIKNGYAQAIEQGYDYFQIQLTKNNQGFTYKEITAIKAAIGYLQFNIPTHISILPKGKKPQSSPDGSFRPEDFATNTQLFDGLQTIYTKEVVN